MHAGDASFYPKAGLFRQGRRTYSVRHLRLPDSYWHQYLEKGISVVCTKRVNGPFGAPVNGDTLWSVLQIDYDTVWRHLHLRPTIRGVYLAIHVWRIQRFIRCCLRRKFERRALAMLMGLHTRLGHECVFARLPADMLALCVK